MLQVPLKDAALVVLAAAALAANTASAAFDLAMGGIMFGGYISPTDRGPAIQMVVPITSFAQNVATVTGAPTGGTFTLTVANSNGNQSTGAIAFNATPATVAAAIGALNNVVNPLNVTVTGAPGQYAVNFSPILGTCTITANGGGLTGGASPGVAISVPTYSFQVNISKDGSTWTQASRVATVLTDQVSPGGGVIQIDFAAENQYVQLQLTVTGTAPSIVLQDCYISPIVNRYG